MHSDSHLVIRWQGFISPSCCTPLGVSNACAVGCSITVVAACQLHGPPSSTPVLRLWHAKILANLMMTAMFVFGPSQLNIVKRQNFAPRLPSYAWSWLRVYHWLSGFQPPVSCGASNGGVNDAPRRSLSGWCQVLGNKQSWLIHTGVGY